MAHRRWESTEQRDESEEAKLEEKVIDVANRPWEAEGGRRRRRGLSDYQIKMAFLTPTLVLLIAWNIFPLLWSLYLSFCTYSATASQPAQWVGSANYRAILNDPRPPKVTSGIRLGTPAVTTRGLKEGDMGTVASFIDRACGRRRSEARAGASSGFAAATAAPMRASRREARDMGGG